MENLPGLLVDSDQAPIHHDTENQEPACQVMGTGGHNETPQSRNENQGRS